MLWLQGHRRLILVLVLVSICHVSSRSTCKSPKRYLNHNLECVKCPPEQDCPEGSFRSRQCGHGFQTECLPCLNCTTVYRTVWKPCTPTSQTECGDCLPGFFAYLGTCVHDVSVWPANVPHSTPKVTTTAVHPNTPEVALARITSPHLPIFIGVSASAAALFFAVMGLATFRIRKARNANRTTESDCERSCEDGGIYGDGCEGGSSITDEVSTDIIPTLGYHGKLSTDSGCDLSWSQDSSSWDSRNPPLAHSVSPTDIVKSPPHFYTMERAVDIYGNPAEVDMFNKINLWVDVAKATVGVNGGCLRLPALSTYLCIDRVERDTDIQLAVLNSPKYLPELAKGESLVSPVISCSPHGVSFQNPALLSFPHCGGVTSADVTLLVSETSLDEAPKWKEASLNGSCGVNYMVKGDECLVYTSHFTLFGLKAKSKKVKIMIFSKLFDTKNRFFEIHAFCVNDTPESLSAVKDQERNNGFHLTCPPKEITFLSNDKDVKVKMSLNTEGWEMPTQPKQLIDYKSVQQNSNPQGQYVSFHLRAVSQDTCASVHVVAKQKSSSSVAEFDFPLSLMSNEQDGTSYPTSAIERFLSAEQSPSPASFLYCLTGGNSTYQPNAIPQDLREKLMSRLDVKVPTGNDFRSFASELGFDSSQRDLLDQRVDSPTHYLLMYMELCGQKRRQTSSEILQELAQIFIRIERSDLATLIESQLQQRPLSLASNSTTDSGFEPSSPSASQLSVATSVSEEPIDIASTPGKPHIVNEELETSGLLKGSHQNLPNIVVKPIRTSKLDSRSKVQTEV
ncbi:netrin receptor UNC5A-like [Branchiostoma lanceolatum]|uniref:netrin receptor UNC5A-like n=1 Tax=Branchiostoma lanceolatum TaxID=7740 RepID=UPI003454E49B